MSGTRPEFHLRRTHADGTAGPVEVYPVPALGSEPVTRRSLLGTGVSFAAAVAAMSGCGTQRELTVPRTRAEDTEPAPLRDGAGEIALPPEDPPLAHTAAIVALAFSPDGSLLVSGGIDRSVKLWSVPDARLLRTVHTFETYVTGVAVSPDGSLLAAIAGTTAGVWRIADGAPMGTITLQRASEPVIAFDPAGGLLVVGAGPGLSSFALPDLSPAGAIDLPMAPVGALAFDPRGRVVHAAGGVMTGQVASVDVPDGPVRRTIDAHAHSATDIAVSPSGALIASMTFIYDLGTGAEDRIRIWRAEDGAHLRDLRGHRNRPSGVAWTTDEDRLVSADDGGRVYLWDVPARQVAARLALRKGDYARSVAASAGVAAVGTSGGSLVLWRFDSAGAASYLFDPAATAPAVRASTYEVHDTITGRTITFTLPCGSPIPAGATCICNCVPGTFSPAVPAAPARPPAPVRIGGGTHCTCNKVCVCIPVRR